MGKVTIDVTLARLTEEERFVLLRFMQGGLQEMAQGDWHGTIYGTGVPPGGEPTEGERDENGYLATAIEMRYVEPIFRKLFPGREIFEYFPQS